MSAGAVFSPSRNLWSLTSCLCAPPPSPVRPQQAELLGLPSRAAVQPWMAAAWTVAILQYRLDLEAHRLPANKGRKQLVCMDQYRPMFGTTRIPGPPSESDFFAQHAFQNSMHVAVSCRGRLYRVEVMRRLPGASASAEPAIVALDELAAAFALVADDVSTWSVKGREYVVGGAV